MSKRLRTIALACSALPGAACPLPALKELSRSAEHRRKVLQIVAME
jgi:hypothetical protein